MKKSIVALALLVAFNVNAANNPADEQAAIDAVIMKFSQPINQWDSYVADINAEASRLGLHFTGADVDNLVGKLNNAGNQEMKRSIISGLVATSVVISPVVQSAVPIQQATVPPQIVKTVVKNSDGSYTFEFPVKSPRDGSIATNNVTFNGTFDTSSFAPPLTVQANEWLSKLSQGDASAVAAFSSDSYLVSRMNQNGNPNQTLTTSVELADHESRITALEQSGGSQGEKGEKGEKGDTGAAGRDGVDGRDGTDGVTTTQIQVDTATQNQVGTNTAKIDGNSHRIDSVEVSTHDHEQRIIDNTNNIAVNSSRIDTVEVNVQNHEQRITANEGQIADNLQTINGHEQRISSNSGRIDQNTDAIDAQSNRVTANEKDIAQNKSDIKANADKNSQQDVTIDDHEHRISENKQRIDQYDGEIEEMNRQVGKIQSFNGRISSNEQRLDSVEHHQKQQDKRIDENHKKAMAGVSSALAIGGLHYTDTSNSMALGSGSYGGASAVALGYQHTNDAGNLRFSAQTSYDTTGNVGVSGSVAIGW